MLQDVTRSAMLSATSRHNAQRKWGQWERGNGAEKGGNSEDKCKEGESGGEMCGGGGRWIWGKWRKLKSKKEANLEEGSVSRERL